MRPFSKQNKSKAGNSTARLKQKRFGKSILSLALLAIVITVFATTAQADVVTQISSREAYVGSPVTLYVQVSGTGNPDIPTVPEVDGLDIRSVGTPSRSSRVMIINGRRSESSSVTYSFQVTPRREGTFLIPAFEINTGSKVERTKPVRIAATKSETGDLMFAEIEGNGQKVFVGQPIDSKLKIWIKPFVDRSAGVKLSPSQMWQLMSEQSEWGGFKSTLEELAQNRQSVAGREVLRKDADGIERAYYLYEIDATIYPKVAGVLDAQDVQIVYQYPLALGKSRDPFDSFFDDSSFGGSSLAKQFFSNSSAFGGRSPFSRSLTITDARPIVVEPSVTDIEIASIPTNGRPDDYRGAVGRYVIDTHASPTHVKAGDPITLQIGIRGTGPMELVQAPPLHASTDLTKDFKVDDESLAGVVRGDIKVFSTTIRPRREGVAQIPAISFSFFDPDIEQFVTVKSDPISIEVDQAETLALDAIVGAGKSASSDDPETQTADAAPTFQLDNSRANSVLTSYSATTPTNFWWLAVIPPGIWLSVLLLNWRGGSSSATSGKWVREIRKSQTASTLAETVQRALQQGKSDTTNSLQRSIPAEFPAELRERVRAFYSNCDQSVYGGSSGALAGLKSQAKQIVRDIPASKANRWHLPKFQRPFRKLAFAGLAAGLIAAAVFTFVESSAHSNEDLISMTPTAASVSLDHEQQQQLLTEATAAYDRGLSLAASDVAESKLAFASAAEKYQLLTDSGIRNSQLYSNLGNAFLQQDKIGNAIASFETARRIDPTNGRATNNLELAKQRISNVDVDSASNTFWTTISAKAFRLAPPRLAWAIFGTVWLGFWLIASATLSRWSIFESWNGTLIGTSAVLVLIACGWIVAQHRAFDTLRTPIAVVTDVQADVRAGAGEEFQPASGFEPDEGVAWRILQQRGDWCQVESNSGSTGWVKNSDVAVVPSV